MKDKYLDKLMYIALIWLIFAMGYLTVVQPKELRGGVLVKYSEMQARHQENTARIQKLEEVVRQLDRYKINRREYLDRVLFEENRGK